MPGIQPLLQDSACNHKLTDFVKRYWHYSVILAMGKIKFTADYCKWAKKQGYRLNERKAEEIFALSQNGILSFRTLNRLKLLLRKQYVYSMKLKYLAMPF